MTVEAEERSLRYQGVVPLAGASLAESLETYFASSEQLPTRVLLAADDRQVAGLLVQKLPEAAADEATHSAWQAAQRGIELLDGERLLNEPAERLLAGTFSGHDLRLFRGGAGAVRVPLQRGPRHGPAACAGRRRGPGRAEGAGLGHGDVRVLPAPVPV